MLAQVAGIALVFAGAAVLFEEYAPNELVAAVFIVGGVGLYAFGRRSA